MKLLIIHLSDIHVKAGSDPVFAKRDELLASVRHLTSGIDAAVLAISGDLTQSATEEQLYAAWEYLDGIQTQLTEYIATVSERKILVHVVAVPGNHDADLSTANPVRDRIMTTITEETLAVDSNSVFAVCTSVHERFFEFLDGFSSTQRTDGGRGRDMHLVYKYDLPFPQVAVSFLCCNTAWMSRIGEAPGSLIFPLETFPETTSANTLVVAMFHHPYNWLKPKNGRAFRRKVEGVANIILTGHEHDAEWRIRQGPTGQRNLYLEGGILQAHDNPDHSTFNAVLVDTDNSRQKVVPFAWDGSRYVPDEGAWEDLQGNRLRGMGRYQLTSGFEQSLADPGIPHGRSDVFGDLEEFYIYPEIKRERQNGGVEDLLKDGQQIRDAVLSEPILAILGEDQAGKTSLGKILFLDMLNSGHVPVLLTGDGRRPPQGGRLRRFLEDSFTKQYARPDRLHYQQLDRRHKVVIVDDLHRFKFKRLGARKFLAALEEQAAHVVVLADEIQMQLAGLVDSLLVDAHAVPYPVFRIQPFGRTKRLELINRWLTLTDDDSETGLSIAHRFSEVKNLLDDVMSGRPFPAYPVFLLSILQEIPRVIDAAAASKGYCQELLIRKAIAYGRTEQEIDFFMTYLKDLAYRIFQDGTSTMDEQAWRGFHRDYECKYAIDRDRNLALSELMKIRILASSGDIGFRYDFVLYYFVALYMRDDLADDELRAEIMKLAGKLHERAASGILLCLAHLSKQPVVIESIVAVAEERLRGMRAGFTEDEGQFLVNLMGGSNALPYREADEITMHQQASALADHLEREFATDEPMAETDSEESSRDYAGTELGAAMSIIELLGQLLRGYPGSLEANAKQRLMAACVDLGLRVIGCFLDELRRNQDEMVVQGVELVSTVLSEAIGDDGEAREVALRVGGSCVGFAGMGVLLGVIHRVVASLKSRDLEVTCERVMAGRDTAAERVLSLGIALQRPTFPIQIVQRLARDLRNTELALELVRWLVLQIFTFRGVDRQTKQRACAALGIEYQATLGNRSVDRRVTNVVI